MSKGELRTAFIGSGDEESQEPFSYDSLIAKSKEDRAAARRQKMEAEAELEDLDSSYKSVLNNLEKRDIDADKLLNAKFDDEDDLALLARSFQMNNIRKAMAGDRTLTIEEKNAQIKSLASESIEAKNLAAAHEGEYDSDQNEEEDVIIESESDSGEEEPLPYLLTQQPADGLSGFLISVIGNPNLLRSCKSRLLELARCTESHEIDSYFKSNLFDPMSQSTQPTSAQMILIKIVSLLFPLDHMRHSIVNPTIKLLESVCFSASGNICHLRLLCDFLVAGQKYSAAFMDLAGRLYRQSQSDKDREELLALTGQFCACFTKEALYGPIRYYFPELMDKLDLATEPFIPMKLHHFKPVEVLGLEPAFHEDGSEWNGQHKEMKEAKRMTREFKKEKKLTVKEMRREAAATETFHAIERKKEKEKTEVARKRFESHMQQAEQNWRLTKTDQGKEDKRKMKSNKKRRRQ